MSFSANKRHKSMNEMEASHVTEQPESGQYIGDTNIDNSNPQTSRSIDTYPQCFEDFWKNGGYVEWANKVDYKIMPSDVKSLEGDKAPIIDLKTFDMHEYYRTPQKIVNMEASEQLTSGLDSGRYFAGPL
eukprot:TRINITY_DN7665_c0_g1_i1.p1 TRINITY_DN7665_c0_g1~~TRINITY_DN7665_c0_g1_i1.p1  ORF type:complete len:130 (-),score=21.90 TRINITY_DN7665_c0_g1_i1:138-527(-)